MTKSNATKKVSLFVFSNVYNQKEEPQKRILFINNRFLLMYNNFLAKNV